MACMSSNSFNCNPKVFFFLQIKLNPSKAGEEGEDDIEATVKSLIDAGTCDGVGGSFKQ